MIEKNYPVLLRFKKNGIKLILDVKYMGGFYFEQYIITREESSGYVFELFKTIFESEAIEYFEKKCA